MALSHSVNLVVHAYEWKVKDESDEKGHVVIHCWALDRESKPHLLRFHDFPAYCYVELPLFIGNSRVNWTGYKVDQVYQAICYKLAEHKPYKYYFKKSEKYYYYRQGKKYPMMVLLFNTVKAMFKCKSKLSRPFKVRDLGTVACNVWETNIPLVRKLLTLRNVKYCQWFSIKGLKADGDDKISLLDAEYIVDRKTMVPIPQKETSSWVTHPTILSFDIETYSDRHKALPDPYSSKHVVYMVSCVFQRSGYPETRKTDIILYGDCNDTDMANVIKVDSEIGLIDTMSELVQKYDPDILTGYNILGYDNPYLDTRLKRRLRSWKPMGRLLHEPTVMTSFSWGSSGYGHNDINILEMDGRIMIDLLPIIRRDYKLKLYNLGFVSNFFLGRTKHDVSAKQMFEAYELGKDSEQTPNKKLIDYVTERLDLIKTDPDLTSMEDLFTKLHVMQYMPKLGDNPRIPKLENVPDITLKEHAMEEMKKVVDYCVVDSDLVLDIFEKIHCWVALIEMANVNGVTPVELFTRGQQLRVISQVYDEASKDDIVIDSRQFEKIDYSGGFVYDPVPGIYHYIPCLDFKSLYPTVMISHNIDHRTFVPEEMMDKIPDEKCHVIEWTEEIKDKKTKEIREIDYRFKFIKQEYLLGILPRLLTRLISERDEVRKIQRGKKKGSIEWIVLERRQLALKVSANSVPGNSPVPCLVNGVFEYRTIEELADESSWLQDRENNQVAKPRPNIKVWSDAGWTDIRFVIRHPVRKPLVRVNTHTGCVDCTTEHSLLRSDGTEVKPTDLEIGDRLMHIDTPLPSDTPTEPLYTSVSDGDISVYLDNLTNEEEERAFAWGLFFAEGTCDSPNSESLQTKSIEKLVTGYQETLYDFRKNKRVPNEILNAPFGVRQAFFMGYYSRCENGQSGTEIVIVNEGQIGSAGLYYLMRSLGYKVSISYSKVENKADNFRLQCSTGFRNKNPDGVKTILTAPDPPKVRSCGEIQEKVEYVYDIETVSHHFAAGVGNMIVHNSMYGSLGAQKGGKLPLPQAAACVTAKSRESIKKVNAYLESKGHRIVYGDSVTGDTPILCRTTAPNGEKTIFYRPINQLYNNQNNNQNNNQGNNDDESWIKHSSGKEYLDGSLLSANNIEVWSDKGFTPIKHVMRHKTRKMLYRITTHTGVIKVTEDHSLLDLDGNEITPNEVKVGSDLLTKQLPELPEKGLDVPHAWVWGLFYGDGSCGTYHCKSGLKRSWAINNQNLDYLNKAKRLLERAYPNMRFKILETMESSGVYKLVPLGDVKSMVNNWRPLFYDQVTKYKKVPDILWKCSLKTRQEFYDGYCSTNDITKNNSPYTENYTGAAGMFLLLRSLGHNVSINTRSDKSEVFLTLREENQEERPGVIKKIEKLGYVDDYVYDLETENHHFAAGVGELVVHNTDSSMPDIGITDPTKAYAMAKVAAEELSQLFPPPMLVEDEEVYHTMLCIKKKMYLCVKMNKDGTPVLDRDKLKVKGVLPARRDNCLYQRNCYIDTAWNVLRRKPLEQTYDDIINMCLKLMRKQVPWKELVVIKGLGSHYKSKSYCMKVFSDELCRIGKPAAPGDRLEYVIVKSYGVKGEQLLGYKMRLPSTYLERLETDKPEQIDYEYYIEKALMNCIQKQLFQVGYKKELEALEKEYIEKDRQKVLDELVKLGYNLVVDQLLVKFDGDKEKAIDYLLGTDLKAKVKKLVSRHIVKRGRIVTRINGEPIKMMLKLIQQKRKCTDVIKTLVPVSEVPKIRPVKLNIIVPSLGTNKQQLADDWIKKKTSEMREKARD